MSAQDSSAPDGQRLQALAKQLDDLEQKSSQLVAALRHSSRVRMCLRLAVIVIVGVSLGALWMKGQDFVSDPEPLFNALHESALANEDELRREAKSFYDHVRPTLEDAFRSRFEHDEHLYATALEKEATALAENARKDIESRIQSHYRNAIAGHRAILEQQFPEVNDPEAIRAMMTYFQGAFDPVVEKHYRRKVNAELDAMYGLWEDFPPARRPRGEEESLETQLYNHLIALMKMKAALVSDETEEAETMPKRRGS